MTVEDAIDAGLVFAGTPDDVFDQLQRLLRPCRRLRPPPDDGPGRPITHDDTVANLTLFSKEVLPRLAELG